MSSLAVRSSCSALSLWPRASLLLFSRTERAASSRVVPETFSEGTDPAGGQLEFCRRRGDEKPKDHHRRFNIRNSRVRRRAGVPARVECAAGVCWTTAYRDHRVRYL